MNVSYEKTVEELYKIKTWLEDLKIKNIDNSRLPAIIEYSSQLNNEFKRYSEGKPNNLFSLKKDVETAAYEGVALSMIYRGLSLMNQNHLPKKKLEKCICGPFSSLEEKHDDNTNQARNTLFELETNAYMKVCGLNVLPEFEDANFSVDRYKVSIQCKRPLSDGKLIDNLDEAYEQLVDNNYISKDDTSYGLIAVSWEKLYQLDKVRPVQNRRELQQLAIGFYNDFMQKIGDFWKEKKNTKLLGLMLSFKSPVVFKDKKTFQGINWFMVHYPQKDYPTPQRKIYKELHKLKKVRIGDSKT